MAKTDPIIVTVGGGKGGVGKSIVATNIAVACAELGHKTLLLDADLGSANSHTMLGIERPIGTIQSFLNREISSLEKAITPTRVENLSLIAGVGAVPGAANLQFARKQKLLNHIKKLEVDVTIIDVGAGINYNVVDFVELADLRIGVLTPQLTSLQNAYSFFKASVYRVIHKALKATGHGDLYTEIVTENETDRIGELLANLQLKSPDAADLAKNQLRGFGGYIIGNSLASDTQKSIFHAFSRMLREFLGVDTPVLALLSKDTTIEKSISERSPLVSAYPGNTNAKHFFSIAEQLLNSEIKIIRENRDTSLQDGEHISQRPSGLEEEDKIQDFRLALDRVTRKTPRFEVNLNAQATIRGKQYSVKLRDLSKLGARLEVTTPMTEGDQVLLNIDGIGKPIMSVVRRYLSSHREAAMEFLEGHQLEDSVLNQIVVMREPMRQSPSQSTKR